MPRAPRKLISIDAAAEICGVHRVTIRRRIADGSLTGYRVGPRYIRVDQAEVEKFLKPVPVTGTYGGNISARARRILSDALAQLDQTTAEAAGNGKA